MQRTRCFAEEISASQQIGPVVNVASIRRTATGNDDAGAPKFTQMVRNQVLGLPDELDELSDAAIATAQFDDQLPPQRVAEQSEDLRRRLTHEPNISGVFDSFQVDGMSPEVGMRPPSGDEAPVRLRGPTNRPGLSGRLGGFRSDGDDVDEMFDSNEVRGVARVEAGTMGQRRRSDEEIHDAGTWLSPGPHNRCGELSVSGRHLVIDGEGIERSLEKRQSPEPLGSG